MFDALKRLLRGGKAGIPELTVEDLKSLMERKEPCFLLDVREPDEHEFARIPGSHLIPLGQVPGRLAEIPKDRPIVVHCKSGSRSARAVSFLLKSGCPHVANLTEGIDAWSERVDPTVPRY